MTTRRSVVDDFFNAWDRMVERAFSLSDEVSSLTPEERRAVNQAMDEEIERTLFKERSERQAPAGWDTLENVR